MATPEYHNRQASNRLGRAKAASRKARKIVETQPNPYREGSGLGSELIVKNSLKKSALRHTNSALVQNEKRKKKLGTGKKK